MGQGLVDCVGGSDMAYYSHVSGSGENMTSTYTTAVYVLCMHSSTPNPFHVLTNSDR